MKELDYLISELIKEDEKLNKIVIPKDIEDKKKLYRFLRNIREEKRISDEYLVIQDNFLQSELKRKKVTNVKELKTIKKTLNSKLVNADKIVLWQGDITLLNVDAIVNPAQEDLLGCFIPNHTCVDNAIHSGSGMQLRSKCAEIMQGKILPLGENRITKGYNLPCKYIIHFVAPSVFSEVHDSHINILKESYYNILETARLNNIKTIAFPTLSFSEQNFPKDIANKALLVTIRNYLHTYPNAFNKIILNVYTDDEYKNFKKIIH